MKKKWCHVLLSGGLTLMLLSARDNATPIRADELRIGVVARVTELASTASFVGPQPVDETLSDGKPQIANNAYGKRKKRRRSGSITPTTPVASGGITNASTRTTPAPGPALKPSALLASVGPSIATVSGHQLLLQRRYADGSLGPATPYTIRGVNWSPASRGTNTTPVDPNNATVRRSEFGIWVNTDAQLLETLYANTVRLYIDPGCDDTGRAVLDELYRRDIMVIMTVDDAINDMQRISSAVNCYRNHPAILMWSLGSEWNLNRYFRPSDFPTILSAAQATQSAASLIKSLDNNHPVSTSYGGIDINSYGLQLSDTQNYVNNVATSVDIWSLNIYRGSTFGTVFDQWKSISGKPMFIGEFGTDAFDTSDKFSNPPQGFIDEGMQAQRDTSLWNDLANHFSAVNASNVALGGLIFELQDEWWKVQPPGSQQTGGFISGAHPDGFANEEFFGILDIDRRPRQAYTSFRNLFSPCTPRPPVRVSVATSAGALRVTITAGVGTLRSVQFGDSAQNPSVPLNARIDVAGGPMDMAGSFTYTPAPGTPQISVTVRKLATGSPTQVPLVIRDLCNPDPWHSFVGSGSNVP